MLYIDLSSSYLTHPFPPDLSILLIIFNYSHSITIRREINYYLIMIIPCDAMQWKQLLLMIQPIDSPICDTAITSWIRFEKTVTVYGMVNWRCWLSPSAAEFAIAEGVPHSHCRRCCAWGWGECVVSWNIIKTLFTCTACITADYLIFNSYSFAGDGTCGESSLTFWKGKRFKWVPGNGEPFPFNRQLLHMFQPQPVVLLSTLWLKRGKLFVRFARIWLN